MTVNYKAIAKKLKFEGRAFINGKYVNAIDGKKFETLNPATGQKLCAVAKCNHKDVDLAVKISRKDGLFPTDKVEEAIKPFAIKELNELSIFLKALKKHNTLNQLLDFKD